MPEENSKLSSSPASARTPGSPQFIPSTVPTSTTSPGEMLQVERAVVVPPTKTSPPSARKPTTPSKIPKPPPSPRAQAAAAVEKAAAAVEKAVADKAAAEKKVKETKAADTKYKALAEAAAEADKVEDESLNPFESKPKLPLDPTTSFCPPVGEPPFPPQMPTPRPVTHAWEERPATAPALRSMLEEEEVPKTPVEHVACPTCGRRFTPDRLPLHRRACAGQALPGFRASVAALDVSEREEEIVAKIQLACDQRVEVEVNRTNEMRRRLEGEEAKVRELEASLLRVEAKAERAEAAAKSMEAAYDVVNEAMEGAKKKEGESTRRLEEVEARLKEALAKQERSEAAAKSMEAAYDVVEEALADSKRREGALKTRIEELEGGAKEAAKEAEEIAKLTVEAVQATRDASSLGGGGGGAAEERFYDAAETELELVVE